MTNRWREIWAERRALDGAPSLEQAIRLDGFDNYGNAVSAESWQSYVLELASRLGVVPTDSIFEVGCGSGAFLLPLCELGHSVGGLDYSPGLIEAAQTLLPAAELRIGDAEDLDEFDHYDVVVAHSVFHYIPSLENAQRVLERMVRKAVKAVGIFDVPDLATRDRSIATRRSAEGSERYHHRYEGLEHLYYARQWFFATAKSLGLEAAIFDCRLPDYLNAPFRFNVVLRKQ